MSAFIVLGFLVTVSVICGVLATFIAHGYLWDWAPPSIALGATGFAGVTVCAAMVFGLLWAINPDPPEEGERPTVAATAEMTGFAALLWLPIYLYSFTAMSRRYRRDPPDA